jgi:hypothetical protein
MRFVYLFKIYSNRIVKVKSGFLARDVNTALADHDYALLSPGCVTPFTDVIVLRRIFSREPPRAFAEPLFS